MDPDHTHLQSADEASLEAKKLDVEASLAKRKARMKGNTYWKLGPPPSSRVMTQEGRSAAAERMRGNT